MSSSGVAYDLGPERIFMGLDWEILIIEFDTSGHVFRVYTVD